MKDFLYNLGVKLAQNNPLGNANDLGLPDVKAKPSLIGNVLDILLYVGGGLSVIMIIVGGIMYITSAGNPDIGKRARSTITYAVIGLLVTVLAYAIIRLVIGITQGEELS